VPRMQVSSARGCTVTSHGTFRFGFVKGQIA
jgi:hypothetical protein